ncbi:MAG TPA: DUF1871 family protein [Pyrinomonadaceae bacterium]|nr:DUF1871 family protein [Pyrinomonadaceae bacterium]
MIKEVKRREREKIFDAVRSVINEWDPYDLLAGGAPDDEFGSEISAVIRQLDRIRSPRDASYVISRVFSSSFEPESFQVEHCQSVGERLYSALVERGIIEGQN